MKTDFQKEEFIKAFRDRSLGYYENTIEISNDFDYAEDIIDIEQSMRWLIKHNIPLFSIKENASGRKVLDSESCWILDKIKPYLIFDPSCIADGIVRSYFADQIAKSFLIRKILQPNQIFSIIRCILTQTNPPKRNRHGHEPYPIPTRFVLACIPCAVWHRRAMRRRTGSVTLAARLLLPRVRQRGLLFAQGRKT